MPMAAAGGLNDHLEPRRSCRRNNRLEDHKRHRGNAVDSNTDLTVDFGLVPGASIGNYVWLDNNRNGIQDEAPDAGIDGVTVKLLDASGNVDKTTVTGSDADGRPGYNRFDVIPGTYRVQFDLTTLPSDFVVSSRCSTTPGGR